MDAQPTTEPFTIEASGQVLRLRGPLTFATARAAAASLAREIERIGSGAVEADCSGVTRSDSAGLVVLLDGLAGARRRGMGLRYVKLPREVLALAEISEVDALLQRGVGPGATAVAPPQPT